MLMITVAFFVLLASLIYTMYVNINCKKNKLQNIGKRNCESILSKSKRKLRDTSTLGTKE